MTCNRVNLLHETDRSPSDSDLVLEVPVFCHLGGETRCTQTPFSVDYQRSRDQIWSGGHLLHSPLLPIAPDALVSELLN
jgi:hypothetical protein